MGSSHILQGNLPQPGGAIPERGILPSGSIFESRVAVKWLTVASIAGIGSGVIAGVLLNQWSPDVATSATAVTDALVRAWTNSFRVLVVPLVMAQLYLAVATDRSSDRSSGRLGLAIPVTFAGLLVFTAITSLVLTPLLLELPWFAGITLVAPANAIEAAGAAASSGSSAKWVDGFIPPNLFVAASADNILPLMLFALMFALAMRRADGPARDALYQFARAVSHASFTLVGWLLLLTPLVMLSLGFGSAVRSGAAVGGVILGFAALEIIVVLAVTLLLYVIVALSGTPVGRFARALWPAQLTAIATRSSLATLPALLKGATTTLGLSETSAATVLPAGGATLKLSRAVSGPVKLLFLAHVLGIDITPSRLLVFAVTIIVLSASTVGVATVTSGNRSLPAYIAAGVPAEYVVLLAVAVSLTDIFLTVLNASGYLTAATLVDRLSGRRARSPGRQPDRRTPLPAGVPETPVGMS